jgi:hypothetical protein
LSSSGAKAETSLKRPGAVLITPQPGLTKTNYWELIMALNILSENSSFVLPSHRGLTPLEIIEDCLEKKQLLFALGISYANRIEEAQCLQLLSMLDDWNAIAQHQLETVMTANTELG